MCTSQQLSSIQPKILPLKSARTEAFQVTLNAFLCTPVSLMLSTTQMQLYVEQGEMQ